MDSKQRTFTLVPNNAAIAAGASAAGASAAAPGDAAPANPSTRILTSKQLEKLYRQTKRPKRLSRAEQREEDRRQQERIRRELEEENKRAQETARRKRKQQILKDRQQARDDAARAEKKRLGVPLVDCHASQDTLTRFFVGRGGAKAAPAVERIVEEREDDGGDDDVGEGETTLVGNDDEDTLMDGRGEGMAKMVEGGSGSGVAPLSVTSFSASAAQRLSQGRGGILLPRPPTSQRPPRLDAAPCSEATGSQTRQDLSFDSSVARLFGETSSRFFVKSTDGTPKSGVGPRAGNRRSTTQSFDSPACDLLAHVDNQRAASRSTAGFPRQGDDSMDREQRDTSATARSPSRTSSTPQPAQRREPYMYATPSIQSLNASPPPSNGSAAAAAPTVQTVSFDDASFFVDFFSQGVVQNKTPTPPQPRKLVRGASLVESATPSRQGWAASCGNVAAPSRHPLNTSFGAVQTTPPPPLPPAGVALGKPPTSPEQRQPSGVKKPTTSPGHQSAMRSQPRAQKTTSARAISFVLDDLSFSDDPFRDAEPAPPQDQGPPQDRMHLQNQRPLQNQMHPPNHATSLNQIPSQNHRSLPPSNRQTLAHEPPPLTDSPPPAPANAMPPQSTREYILNHMEDFFSQSTQVTLGREKEDVVVPAAPPAGKPSASPPRQQPSPSPPWGQPPPVVPQKRPSSPPAVPPKQPTPPPPPPPPPGPVDMFPFLMTQDLVLTVDDLAEITQTRALSPAEEVAVAPQPPVVRAQVEVPSSPPLLERRVRPSQQYRQSRDKYHPHDHQLQSSAHMAAPNQHHPHDIPQHGHQPHDNPPQRPLRTVSTPTNSQSLQAAPRPSPRCFLTASGQTTRQARQGGHGQPPPRPAEDAHPLPSPRGRAVDGRRDDGVFVRPPVFRKSSPVGPRSQQRVDVASAAARTHYDEANDSLPRPGSRGIARTKTGNPGHGLADATNRLARDGAHTVSQPARQSQCLHEPDYGDFDFDEAECRALVGHAAQQPAVQQPAAAAAAAAAATAATAAAVADALVGLEGLFSSDDLSFIQPARADDDRRPRPAVPSQRVSKLGNGAQPGYQHPPKWRPSQGRGPPHSSQGRGLPAALSQGSRARAVAAAEGIAMDEHFFDDIEDDWDS